MEGYDACRKIAILTSIISGKMVDFEEIYTEGISKVTTEDMKYAKALGMTVKLLAECEKVDGKWFAQVAPCLLYSVHEVFNAVFVKGNMLGDAMFYGSGAGKLPTASAVVADVVAEAKNPHTDIMNFWTEEKLELEKHTEISRRFLVRVEGKQTELESRIQKDFGRVQYVNLEELPGEFGFVTPVMTEGAYMEKAESYPQIRHMLRVEE